MDKKENSIRLLKNRTCNTCKESLLKKESLLICGLDDCHIYSMDICNKFEYPNVGAIKKFNYMDKKNSIWKTWTGETWISY